MKGARTAPKVVRIATDHARHVVTGFRALEEMAASGRAMTDADRPELAVADRARKVAVTKDLVRDVDPIGVAPRASDGKRPCRYRN
jgi:hypothetical protein